MENQKPVFMENEQLFELLEQLPYYAKCKVQHLVIHLTGKSLVDKDLEDTENLRRYKTIMADDFDEPLKEFHDYMYEIDVEFINKIERLPLSMQKEIESSVDMMLDKIEKHQI